MYMGGEIMVNTLNGELVKFADWGQLSDEADHDCENCEDGDCCEQRCDDHLHELRKIHGDNFVWLYTTRDGKEIVSSDAQKNAIGEQFRTPFGMIISYDFDSAMELLKEALTKGPVWVIGKWHWSDKEGSEHGRKCSETRFVTLCDDKIILTEDPRFYGKNMIDEETFTGHLLYLLGYKVTEDAEFSKKLDPWH